MGVVGGGEDGGALLTDGAVPAVVNVGRCVKADPGVAMIVVAPGEERSAVQPGGLDRGELEREAGPGFEAEVDFADLFVDVPAGRMKCYPFTLRICFSGRWVHRVCTQPNRRRRS